MEKKEWCNLTFNPQIYNKTDKIWTLGQCTTVCVDLGFLLYIKEANKLQKTENLHMIQICVGRYWKKQKDTVFYLFFSFLYEWKPQTYSALPILCTYTHMVEELLFENKKSTPQNKNLFVNHNQEM